MTYKMLLYNERIKNLDLIYNGSVAIDYFFKRKKYFNQIFE